MRLVPSAPFLVVNMIAGVTPMTFADFAAGTTAIGIVPKIALMALAGRSVIEARHSGAALAASDRGLIALASALSGCLAGHRPRGRQRAPG